MIFKRLAFVISFLAMACIAACQPTPQTPSSAVIASTATAAPAPQSVQPTPAALVASPKPAGPSAEAKAYLNAALDIMEQHSLNRRTIDWTKLRTTTFERAAAARVPADTYTVIRSALMELGDHHSIFNSPEDGQAIDNGSWQLTPPTGMLVHDRIASIVVPAFLGNEAQAISYAEQAHAVIARLDQARPCGWIVDLRDNTGGNMWPMLAGIGPVLGDGMAGAFTDLDDQHIDYGYYAGAAREGQETVIKVNTPYQLRAAMPTVAVLTSGETASSGEAITVAFRGRPDTKSFGQSTYGVSSGNEGFPLSDGAFIYLTTSVFADRTGVRYGQEIVPDTVVSESREAAATWLLEQPACRPE